MVHSDHGRVSLSCCIRRDQLDKLRRQRRCSSAGEAVLAHIQDHCRGARQALLGARREMSWLSAGPIHTGVRSAFWEGVFLVGNAAGEAHPVVAEGISMAMQSSWLLSQYLLSGRGPEYAAAWQRHFAPRIQAAALLAHWAMQPAAVAALLPVLHTFPSLLTVAARWSGKTHQLVTAKGSLCAT